LTHKTNNISILQFNERIISRLRVRRSTKGIEVIGFDRVRGEWPAHDGTLANKLKEFAAKHHLAEDPVYTILPRHDITARILTLPSQDPQELDSMVRLSAEEFVPFPLEELIIDQSILQKLPDGQARVLTIFAHYEVVEAHIAFLQEARIDPEQIYLSTACLATAAGAVVGPRERSFALVNLAPGGLEIIVIENNQLEYGRAIASMQEWDMEGPTAEEALEELAVETRASLTAYRRESETGEGVDAVYLCSGFADVTRPCENLFHELGQECTPARFARDLITHGAEHLSENLAYPVAMLGAALIAQGRGNVKIQLLPQTLLDAREKVGTRKTAIRFAIIAAAIFLALIGLYAEAVYQRTSYQQQLRNRIEAIRPHAEGINSKQRQLRILQRQLERSGGAVELLAAICDVLPKSGINISRFLFMHNDRIEISGRASNLPMLDRLIDDFHQAGKSTWPQFASAQRIYEKEVMERNQPVLEYKIRMLFPETESPEGEEDELEESEDWE